MKRTLFPILFIGLLIPVRGIAQETMYKRPAAILEEVAMAKLSPVTWISDSGEWALLMERSPYRSIAKLAQPELRIAGTRINPVTFGGSRVSEFAGVTLLHVPSGKEVTASGLPAGAVVINAEYSPSEKEIVLFVEENDGVYLFCFSAQLPQVRKITGRKLNTTTGTTIQWINDTEFFTLAVPSDVGAPPEKPLVPAGPVIQESTGQKEAIRTFQDLLKDPYDESLFDYYFTSQLIRVDMEGPVKEVGEPAIYGWPFSLSPDRNYFLASTLHRPYSYLVPMSYFPQKTFVMDLSGKIIRELQETPVLNLPSGYDVASPYPRSYGWRADKPATLFWVEAQDGGNPRENKVEYMDIVYQWDYPFDGVKEEVGRTIKRFRNILWHDDSFALLYEYSRTDNRTKTWQIKPASEEAPVLLVDLSMDDSYNNPGNPLTVKNQYNRNIVYTDKAHNELLMLSNGASPEGDMPYISRFTLKDKKNRILWRCEAPFYETVVKVTDPAKLQVITSCQSNTEPANLFVRDLKRKRSTQLTRFPNPYPAMEGVSKEKIFYKRADGVDMTATVYLPAGYDKEKDGPLPVLMWAYPREFRSATDAAQVRGSRYTFTNIGNGSPVFWVLRGFCVMENVEMPIVSTSEGVQPNDNFIEQLTMNAEAAIKVISEMGVGDPERVAIGGHSYGAFMTANLLTRTNLFKAGIARSGAYNRTLTPFGFQNEARTYWEAPEVYNNMSPFMHADKLNGALLIIHGELDNNTGTFPIQSERLYSALKGHGAVTRYVVLPYESHGYVAEENILHLLYECDEWLDKYVKNASR